ncbi:dentin sialophosphoprotein-like [Paramacrobiotus metropolitanus]|uniref:dentin sialophosphoprotein-like n=1 Tax=Paramacrobiotus metropolitanus TaxID=2943436 RepID=UPI0024457EBC|nr:dentin sialophosphoprotein-like [Paramacrobiotus metropolitanus]
MAINWGSIDSNVVNEIRSEYEKYGRFGDDAFHGDNITLKNLDKWLSEAGVLGDRLSATDTGIAFKRILSNEQRTMPFDKFKDFISDLAHSANPSNPDAAFKDMVAKLHQRRTPSKNSVTEPVKSDVVDRLTDPAGYTGTQRFSADGKAVDGRHNLPDLEQVRNDGYVAGYKNAETYDRDHSVNVPKYDAEEERKRQDAAHRSNTSSDTTRNRDQSAAATKPANLTDDYRLHNQSPRTNPQDTATPKYDNDLIISNTTDAARTTNTPDTAHAAAAATAARHDYGQPPETNSSILRRVANETHYTGADGSGFRPEDGHRNNADTAKTAANMGREQREYDTNRDVKGTTLRTDIDRHNDREVRSPVTPAGLNTTTNLTSNRAANVTDAARAEQTRTKDYATSPVRNETVTAEHHTNAQRVPSADRLADRNAPASYHRDNISGQPADLSNKDRAREPAYNKNADAQHTHARTDYGRTHTERDERHVERPNIANVRTDSNQHRIEADARDKTGYDRTAEAAKGHTEVETRTLPATNLEHRSEGRATSPGGREAYSDVRANYREGQPTYNEKHAVDAHARSAEHARVVDDASKVAGSRSADQHARTENVPNPTSQNATRTETNVDSYKDSGKNYNTEAGTHQETTTTTASNNYVSGDKEKA